MFRVVILSGLIILASCKPKVKSENIAQSIKVPVNYDKVEEIPVAVTYDTALELDFIETANRNQTTFQVSEVIITSGRWASTFSESGNVVARSREASAIATKDGKCYLQEMIFEQKTNTTGFEKTEITKKKGWKVFDCSLLENKKPDAMVGLKLED